MLALVGLLALTSCGGGGDVAAPTSPGGSSTATASSGPPSDGPATTSPSGPGTPSTSPSARRGSPPVLKPPPVLPPEAQGGLLTLVRSGGLSGTTTVLVVRSDGMVLVKGHTGAQPRTTLSAARLSEVRALVTSPALAAEARQASASGPLRQPRCSDAFRYDLTAGNVRMATVGCGPISSYPAFRKLLQLLGPLLG